jgi:hypothetical protein
LEFRVPVIQFAHQNSDKGSFPETNSKIGIPLLISRHIKQQMGIEVDFQ